eukprot:6824547-Prymnesium_polylepis.1
MARRRPARGKARERRGRLIDGVLRPDGLGVHLAVLRLEVGNLGGEPAEDRVHAPVVDLLLRRRRRRRRAHVDEARVEQRHRHDAARASLGAQLRVGRGRRVGERAAGDDVDVLPALVRRALPLLPPLHRPRRVELHQRREGVVRRLAHHRERVDAEVHVGVEREHVVAAADHLPREPPPLQEEHVRVRLAHRPLPAVAAGVHEVHADARVAAADASGPEEREAEVILRLLWQR